MHHWILTRITIRIAFTQISTKVNTQSKKPTENDRTEQSKYKTVFPILPAPRLGYSLSLRKRRTTGGLEVLEAGGHRVWQRAGSGVIRICWLQAVCSSLRWPRRGGGGQGVVQLARLVLQQQRVKGRVLGHGTQRVAQRLAEVLHLAASARAPKHIQLPPLHLLGQLLAEQLDLRAQTREHSSEVGCLLGCLSSTSQALSSGADGLASDSQAPSSGAGGLASYSQALSSARVA